MPERIGQLRHRLADVHDADRERIVGLIRHAADEHFVEHDAETVEIAAPVDRAAARLFRAHVVRRADDRAGLRHPRCGIERTRDAEIGQRRGAVVAQQDVVGLDVAVHEAFLVRVIERGRDLADHAQRERDRPRIAVLVQDRPAAEIFHRDVVVVAGAADVVDADDVAMVQLRDDFRFAQEALAEIRIGEQRRRHDLQRDLAIDRFLHREIDGRHAASAELAQADGSL